MLKLFSILMLGINAPSLNSECDKPFMSGFKFMERYKNQSPQNIIEKINGVIYVEEWRFIEGYSDCYEISSFGRVRSHYYNARVTKGVILKKRSCPKILKQQLNTKRKYVLIRMGYIGFGQLIKTLTVHRIVAKHFLDNYTEDLEVNHEDGDRFNNHYTNLSMMTRQENMAHAWNSGLVKIAYGKMQSRTKLTEEQVIEIYNSTLLPKELSETYKVCRRQIWMIKSGRNWSHLTIDKE